MDDERELIERCRAGDLSAFRPLVERHEDRIYGLTRSMLADEEDARDAAQDAFIRAFKSIDRFKGDASFYTWVYRIAVNVCLNAARKQARRTDKVPIDAVITADEVPPESLFEEGTGTSDFERVELRDRVHALLDRLSPEHRQVIVLKDIEDRSQEEIAELLDISVGTIKSRLSRARIHLKRLMKPLYDEWTGRDEHDRDT